MEHKHLVLCRSLLNLAEDPCRLELCFLRGFAAILISFIIVLFVFYNLLGAIWLGHMCLKIDNFSNIFQSIDM